MKRILVAVFILVFINSLALAQTKIKGNFYYDNVSFTEDSSGRSIAKGDLINKSGKDCDAVTFLLSIYDIRGELIDKADIVIVDFLNLVTEPFSIYIKADYRSIAKYKIEFKAN